MTSHVVGYPRIGPKRELKFALESMWDGKTQAADLEKVAQDLSVQTGQALASATMEDESKTVATGMAIGIATTTVGILLAALIQTQMVPLAILAAKFVWEWGCSLTSRFTEFLLNRIFALASLLATFVQRFILHRTALVPAPAVAATGAHRNVELHERDGGEAHREDV